ncbi:heavy-metal-associated domain-containing protein [Flavobacterium sp. SM2513]|uniref:heavy-metal-associated domain-containing protein n=1 Tax=Flavobacterium sp. SM2513 TaxID=3424766 RepID=UPI003D7F853A
MKQLIMKKILFVLLISIMGFSTQAQEKKDKNAKREIAVKGNCEMCKKRIEKAAYSVKGVKSAVWTPESQELVVLLNEQKSTTEAIEKAVVKAGHDTKHETASNVDYEKLHECCKYDRK